MTWAQREAGRLAAMLAREERQGRGHTPYAARLRERLYAMQEDDDGEVAKMLDEGMRNLRRADVESAFQYPN